jgi:pimeloyl-ACP methyl ester carboxylesterase
MKKLTLHKVAILALSLVVTHNLFADPSSMDSFTHLTKSKTILFITGAFVTNTGWAEWETYFKQHGYTVYAPAWPYKNASAKELRSRHPDRELASLRLDSVVNYFVAFAERLPEKPILIGHSTGGLIAQILLQRGAGVAAVAYHSVPPKGVLTLKFSFVKSVTPALGLFTSKNKTFMMSFKQWQYAFTNGMPLQEQKDTYEEYTIPESKRLAWSALGKSGKVNFKTAHAPLLFISGSEDHIMPASLNRKNFRKYKDEKSLREYKEFSGRNHFAMGQPTWKEDADYILEWITRLEKSNLDPIATTNGK